jgi:hypothetical protein
MQLKGAHCYTRESESAATAVQYTPADHLFISPSLLISSHLISSHLSDHRFAFSASSYLSISVLFVWLLSLPSTAQLVQPDENTLSIIHTHILSFVDKNTNVNHKDKGNDNRNGRERESFLSLVRLSRPSRAERAKDRLYSSVESCSNVSQPEPPPSRSPPSNPSIRSLSSLFQLICDLICLVIFTIFLLLICL